MATKKENTVNEVENETKKKTPKKYASDELIPCRSITFGELLMTGKKSGLLYSWANHGDVTEVEFQDLQALKSTHSSYLFKPRFVVEDDELTAQWGKEFETLYKDINNVDVEAMFKLSPAQLKSKLKSAPKGVQQAVKNIAGEKIMNGSLDSLAKIKAIDEVLNTDLKLYIQ